MVLSPGLVSLHNNMRTLVMVVQDMTTLDTKTLDNKAPGEDLGYRILASRTLGLECQDQDKMAPGDLDQS